MSRDSATHRRSDKLVVPSERGEMVELEQARREAEASRSLREFAFWESQAKRSRALLGRSDAAPAGRARSKAQVHGRARAKAARRARKRQRR
jgi:hypothetical protein